MSPTEKKQLIEKHKNLLITEANKYSSHLPFNVVLAEAYKLASEAADSFDPKTGNQFSTHLVSQLKKLSRLSTQYGSTVRIPENKQFKAHRVQKAFDELKSELGREPTVQEVADAVHMSLNIVNNLLHLKKQEVALSDIADSPIFGNNGTEEWLHFVYHDLPTQDKIIFEHKTGFGNKPILSSEEIGKKLNLTPSTVNNRLKLITGKIQEGWRDNVMDT